MNDPLVDRERVNEWLQSRTRRTEAPCSIHLSMDSDVAEISRPRLDDHVQRSSVHHQSGRIFDSPAATNGDVITNPFLDQQLPRQVERRQDHARFRALENLLDEMRREKIVAGFDSGTELSWRQARVNGRITSSISVFLRLIHRRISVIRR